MLQSLPELIDPVLGVGELALEDVVVPLQLREDLLRLLQHAGARFNRHFRGRP